jgi:hypothetical protein
MTASDQQQAHPAEPVQRMALDAVMQGEPGFGQRPGQDPGPFYHGTKADLKPGDLLQRGYRSNFGERRKANYAYLTATLDAPTWGAELGPVSNSAARAASAASRRARSAAWAATARLRRVAHSRSASTLRGHGRAVPGMMSGDSEGSVR